MQHKDVPVLNQVAAKPCHFSTRDDLVYKREQIKTAYSISRAGKAGKSKPGALPRLGGVSTPPHRA